jgi:hypothetical protein
MGQSSGSREEIRAWARVFEFFVEAAVDDLNKIASDPIQNSFAQGWIDSLARRYGCGMPVCIRKANVRREEFSGILIPIQQAANLCA